MEAQALCFGYAKCINCDFFYRGNNAETYCGNLFGQSGGKFL